MSTEPLTSLTADEKRILENLLAGEDQERTTLRAQAREALVISRDQTGVGFYTDLWIPPTAPRLGPEVSGTLDGSGSMSGKMCSFILFVRQGAVQTLECVTLIGDLPETCVLEWIEADPNHKPDR